ncbi:MAG TPA: M20/M25/M40 family metallo-hydrolase [Burkholderiaceae bacterium]|nr:M20/M25/M40 family metallo-hydrolase [Burkholderiaceae bacterium]
MYDKLATWIDTHFDEEVAFLRELVRVPTDTPPGDNAPHAERTAVLLEARGFEVERHAVPAALVREHGLKSITNLVVRQTFGAGPTIALHAHGDTVPAGHGWTKPPYEGVIEDGRMYGRGVAVAKSDFATYTFALRALRAVPGNLVGTIELHFTYDQEYGGGLGPAWLLRNGVTKPDLAIGAGFSYEIVTAHNGCLQLEVTLHGKAAPAALPEHGIDALYGAMSVMEALYAERARYVQQAVGKACPTINIGRIEGGTQTNVVPDRVTLRIDRRIVPEENPAEVEHRLRQVIEQAAGIRAGLRVDVRRLLLARPLAPAAGQQRLVRPLKHHAATFFGEEIAAGASPHYTDGRLYAEAGVPIVLYGAGPRSAAEANAQGADENLLLDDLRRATKVVTCTLCDLLAR